MKVLYASINLSISPEIVYFSLERVYLRKERKFDMTIQLDKIEYHFNNKEASKS